MHIELIKKPKQKTKDFILRDISIKKELYKEITTNEDVQKLIRILSSIYMTTKLLHESSRDREIKSFKHILTVEEFIKKQSSGFGLIGTFKNDYMMLCRYFDLIEYDDLERSILTNLRDK